MPKEPEATRWAQIRRAATGLPLRPHRPAGAMAVILLMGTAWAAVRLAGGRQPELADLSYGAVLLSGLYFGALGGAGAGAIAMIMVSPLGPVSPSQPLSSWLVHGSLAICLGGMAGARSYLLDHSQARSAALAESLTNTYRRTLHLIAEAIELRDPITAGHSRRVAVNARVLGTRVGMAEAELDSLYWAGLPHDVGKIAVPETILQKQGSLSADEWSLMRAHPRLGAALIVQTSSDLSPLAVAVASHHECWDGTGYPHGLHGTAIPLTGRILTVVDVFEALTSARLYRAALAAEQALTYVLEGSGTKFDPDLVSAFEELVAEDAIAIAPRDLDANQWSLRQPPAEELLQLDISALLTTTHISNSHGHYHVVASGPDAQTAGVRRLRIALRHAWTLAGPLR